MTVTRACSRSWSRVAATGSIVLMSRNEERKKTWARVRRDCIVTERGDDGVARIKYMADGLGAHSVIEAVGTQESMMQASCSTGPGGHIASPASTFPATNCSSPKCTCLAGGRPCGGSCPH